jgi:co-chaperonin GroES (HSP10)
MQIKPAFNRLLLKTIPEDHPVYGNKSIIVSPTGIQPEDIQSLIMEVVAVPENAQQYKIGDLVFPARTSMRDGIAFRGEKYMIANESEILGVLINDEVK